MSALNNKKKDCSTFLNTMIQILNPAYLANEFNQMMNKNKNNSILDSSKIKALRRRTLAHHYCPFLYLIKDSKSKQDYLNNPSINTEIVFEIMHLCSLQRLLFSYINLNASFLLLIKPKIDQIDGAVVSRQLKMLCELIENPLCKFLNHANLGNKCQNIFNSYISAISNEMSPINILNEVYR